MYYKQQKKFRKELDFKPSKTIHIEGLADDINITDRLSDSYDLRASFYFEEEIESVIKDCFISIYDCNEKCSLEDAIKGYLCKMFGDISVTGQEYGYSEVTIEGFDVTSAKIGGHNIQTIVDSKKGKYLHIIIEQESHLHELISIPN